jgi:hypothetical protein
MSLDGHLADVAAAWPGIRCWGRADMPFGLNHFRFDPKRTFALDRSVVQHRLRQQQSRKANGSEGSEYPPQGRPC